jgi:hypothetical protein
MQPGTKRVGIANRPWPDSQDEESRLKRVFSRVAITQDRAADSQYHRAVPADEDLERSLGGRTIRALEMRQQLPIGQAADCPGSIQNVKFAPKAKGSTALHHEGSRRVS